MSQKTNRATQERPNTLKLDCRWKDFYTKPDNTSTKLMIDPPNLDNIDLKFAKQNKLDS